MNAVYVPNSRLFILGGKGKTEEEFREVFSEFGDIKDVWILKDRRTNEDKGVVYITYAKASMAALAKERMNGQPMSGQSSALKVMIANDKKEGSVREPKEEEKNQRIFIKIPKSMTEREVEDMFKQFGDIEHVNIIKDKASGDSKGLAYVKYTRAYHAALAMENADPSYKAIFAATKVSPRDQRMDMDFGHSGHSGHSGHRPSTYHRSEPDRYDGRMEKHPVFNGGGLPDMIGSYPHEGETRLEVIVPSMVTQEQLFRLFDIVPGLDYCDLDVRSGTAQVKYLTPHATSYARDKLNGFEYPPSYRLSVRFSRETRRSRDRDFASDFGIPISRTPPDRNGLLAHDLNQSVDNFMQAPNLQNNIQTLVEHIKKATSVLESAGVAATPSVSAMPSISHTQTRESDMLVRVRYCNVPLPELQPILPRDSPCQQRLFIVSQPDAFPEHIIMDCFSRFGNLVDAYFMPSKNYGYVKFGGVESAQRAIDTLHGQTVCGQRLKVMPAEPPKNADDFSQPASKRPRS